MSFPMLPVELVYHVLTHAVLCGLREGRVRWTANLLAISRSCHTVLRPVLFQRTVLIPDEIHRMVDFLKYCQLNTHNEPMLGDVRELHVLNHSLPGYATEVFVSALVPARLHTVQIPWSLFRALSNSPEFAPRSFDATFCWPSDISTLPPRPLRSVTHLIVWFPDISSPSMFSSILDPLPVLSHLALYRKMEKKVIPPSDHSTEFYDQTQYLDIFRAIFSREHIVKVVLRFFGIVPMGTYPDKISKLLGSLRDRRLYTMMSDERVNSWDDIGYLVPEEARMGLTVWDMPCRQVYIDNDRDDVNSSEGPSES